uniref:Uncharacterized protein n=1 Tax=Acrobeloides nanus TaxID=290746 RepID=A0A914EM40_9BILA
MDTKGVETILPLPQYTKFLNEKEVEEKASCLEAIRTPTFWLGLLELLFSLILISVAICNRELILGTGIFMVSFYVPILHAIFATAPVIMGTLLCANCWFKINGFYKTYLLFGVMEMAFSTIGLIGCFYYDEWEVKSYSIYKTTSHDAYPIIGRVCVLLFGTIIFGIAQYLIYRMSKQRVGLDTLDMKNKTDVDGNLNLPSQGTCKISGSTIVALIEIFVSGALYWGFVQGLSLDSFFRVIIGKLLFIMGPIWVVMLIVATLLLFVKEKWAYNVYLRFSAIRFIFGCSVGTFILICTILHLLNIWGNWPSWIGYIYEVIWMILILLLVINVVFWYVVKREYQKKETNGELRCNEPENH